MKKVFEEPEITIISYGSMNVMNLDPDYGEENMSIPDIDWGWDDDSMTW